VAVIGCAGEGLAGGATVGEGRRMRGTGAQPDNIPTIKKAINDVFSINNPRLMTMKLYYASSSTRYSVPRLERAVRYGNSL
jgi:hypothetical protein